MHGRIQKWVEINLQSEKSGRCPFSSPCCCFPDSRRLFFVSSLTKIQSVVKITLDPDFSLFSLSRNAFPAGKAIN